MRTFQFHLTFALLLASAACTPKRPPQFVRVDGSSTVFVISEAVSEEFQKQPEQRAVKVTVGISGTGGGFKKFCSGEIDIADASRPIKKSEIELCARNGVEYIELPIAYDGIAIVAHPQNSWLSSITVSDLKKIWEPGAQGVIKKWKDIRPEWPDQPIKLYGAGVDSGTYDYFTEAIVHKEHASRGDYTSSEDDNVLVQGVAGDVGSLGFFGYAYYQENRAKLKLIAVDDEKPNNGAGAISPSPQSIKEGTYQPLSRPIFIYVAKKSLSLAHVKTYIDFYLSQGERLSQAVGYIPLPAQAYTLAKQRVSTLKTGSMFAGGGSQVGVSIEALMKQE